MSLRPSFRFTSYIPFVSIRYFFPFVSPLTVLWYLNSFRCNSFLSFVTSYLLYLLFPIRYFLPFVSILPFRSAVPFVLTLSLHSFFSQTLWDGAIWAGICNQSSYLNCNHLRPLAATCSNRRLRPLAPTCSHSSGCKWLPCTCSRDPLRPAATCGHLRPLAATCGHLRPLAAACGRLWPLEWLQAAAF